MATINAGRVTFVSKGDYNNATQYYKFDLVNYNGGSYVAKENTLGNLPTNGTYWQLIAEKGNTGDTGATGPTGNGIASVTKTSTTGLVDTYTITYTNGNTSTFNLSNGKGISSIAKTGTSGLVDTYTITYNDGTTSTYTVTNGEDGEVTQAQLDETNKELDYYKTLYNAMPKLTGTGTEATIDDTADSILKMDLSGNTYQDSTTGKNLLNISDVTTGTTSGVTYKNNGDGTITFNGTATDTIYLNLNFTNNRINLENGEKYSFGIKNGNSGIKAVVRLYTPNTAVLTVDFGGTERLNITSSYDGEAFVFIQISGGTILSNHTIFPMVTKASTLGDYEPYTGTNPSPSPDYPQDIEVVTGDNEIKVESKNLFDKSTITESLYLNENGTTSSSSSNYYVSNYIRLKPNTTYYKSGTGSPRIKYYNKNKQALDTTTYEDITNGANPTSFTTPSNAYYLRFTGNTNNFSIESVQIELGSTATTYVEHKEQTYPINLGSKNLYDISKISTNTYINTQGTTGDSTVSNVSDYIKVIGGKKYTLSYDYTTMASASERAYCYYDESKTLVSGNAYTATNKENTFTIPNNVSYIRFGIDVNCSNVQFEKGESKTNYIPYREDIELCKIGDYKDSFRQSTGKNLFDGIIEAGYININTGENTGASNIRTKDYIIIEPNTQYTISSNTSHDTWACFYNSSKTFISNQQIKTGTSGTFTTPANAYYIRWYDAVSTGESPLWQLEEGSTATEYEPYGVGTWYKHAEIGKVVLDGSENWQYQSSYDLTNTKQFVYLNAVNPATLYQGLSNYFKRTAGWTVLTTTDENMIQIYLDKAMYIRIDNTLAPDLAGFKTWLSTYNPEVYYALKTPTNTEITDTNLISQLNALKYALAYKDQTNISQINDEQPFIIDYETIYDINNLVTRVSALEG